MILLPMTIALNANGKILFARLYVFVLSVGYGFLITVIQGNQTRGHFFFLAEALVVYFLFPSYQKKNSLLSGGNFTFFLHWIFYLPR